MTVASDDGGSSQAKPSGTLSKPSSESEQSNGSGKRKDSSDPAKVPPPTGPVVTVKIIWLPDTATPYTVTISGAGIGTFKGGLQLTNGWMLTNVSEESDAKVAETLTAVAGLVSGVLSPGGGKTAKELGTEVPKAAPFLYLFDIDSSNHKLTRVDTSPLDEVLAHIVLNQGGSPPFEK
jgi:hypothetical protein